MNLQMMSAVFLTQRDDNILNTATEILFVLGLLKGDFLLVVWGRLGTELAAVFDTLFHRSEEGWVTMQTTILVLWVEWRCRLV
jgi:hypothetical protein